MIAVIYLVFWRAYKDYEVLLSMALDFVLEVFLIIIILNMVAG